MTDIIYSDRPERNTQDNTFVFMVTSCSDSILYNIVCIGLSFRIYVCVQCVSPTVVQTERNSPNYIFTLNN